jgi:hypothetical protein
LTNDGLGDFGGLQRSTSDFIIKVSHRPDPQLNTATTRNDACFKSILKESA